MMEITREDSISFKIANTNDFPALNVFMNIMEKASKEATKKGFRNLYTKEERFFIENFVKELRDEVNNTNR